MALAVLDKVVPKISEKKNPDGLTPLQHQFVKEYLVDLNAAKAAIRAGYSSKTASRIGPNLLGKPNVAAAIKVEIDKRSKRTEITADMVLKELAKIGFCNIDDFVKINETGTPLIDFKKADRDKMAALSEVTQDTYFEGRGEEAQEVKKTKIKLHDKVKSLQLIGNHLGMFRENAGGDDAPAPIKVEIAVIDGRKRDDDKSET